MLRADDARSIEDACTRLLGSWGAVNEQPSSDGEVRSPDPDCAEKSASLHGDGDAKTSTVRHSLIEIVSLRQTNAGQRSKTKLMYQYLTAPGSGCASRPSSTSSPAGRARSRTQGHHPPLGQARTTAQRRHRLKRRPLRRPPGYRWKHHARNRTARSADDREETRRGGITRKSGPSRMFVIGPRRKCVHPQVNYQALVAHPERKSASQINHSPQFIWSISGGDS